MVGDSGVGKTSVLRAIAGRWRSCRSRIVGTQFEWPELLTSALGAEAGGSRPDIANEEDFDANE